MASGGSPRRNSGQSPFPSQLELSRKTHSIEKLDKVRPSSFGLNELRVDDPVVAENIVETISINGSKRFDVN